MIDLREKCSFEWISIERLTQQRRKRIVEMGQMWLRNENCFQIDPFPEQFVLPSERGN